MRKLNPDPGIDGESAPEQPTKTDLMAHAARLLARREFAVRELATRLLRKWAGAENIQVLVNDVISTLQTDGALSDARFADSFIRSRRQRFQGPVKIRSELRQRQVPDAIIEAYLLEAEPGWTELAAQWLSHQHQGRMAFADRARHYRRLMGRGFTHQQAMDALALSSN